MPRHATGAAAASEPARPRSREPGTLLLDPSIPVYHLLLRRESVSREMVDALVASVLKQSQSGLRRRRRPVVLWRGEYETGGSESWQYWALAVEERRTAWYADLREAAIALGLSPSLGTSTPSQLGARPWLRIEGGALAVFDQRRRPHGQVRINLAGTSFEARRIRYRYPARGEAAAAEGEWAGVHPVSREVRLLQRQEGLHVSPLEGWEQHRDFLVGLSQCEDSAELTYEKAVELSTACGITVLELPLAEHGRTVMEPVWERIPEGRRIADCRVSIAVRGSLPEAQRRLALLHELGHYVNHLPHLFQLLLLYFHIAARPTLESFVAEGFPEDWRQDRNRLLELEADYFSACFVVPHAVSGWLRSADAPYPWPLVKGMILQLCHRVFDEGWSLARVEWEELDAAWQTVLAGEYDLSGRWVDRLLHCVALRGTGGLVDMVRDHGRLEEETEAIGALLAAPPLPGRADAGAGPRLLQRCAESEVVRMLSLPDRWDPVIVEPRDGAPARGYVPLKPIFTRGAAVDTFDWARADESDELPGDLAYWWEYAEARAWGLMLFPMNPIEHALRRGRA